MPTIIATPGASNANSYETLAEAVAYFDTRLPVTGWAAAIDATRETLLIMATRTLNAALQAGRTIIYPKNDGTPYYLVRRTWSGSPATTTQVLAWPRVGMYDANGNAIPSNVIPQALKDAESELAGQLSNADRTLDSEVSLQGLKSVKAGSVALTFKDYIERQVIPQAVYDLMPPSWFIDEYIEPVIRAQFDVIQGSI